MIGLDTATWGGGCAIRVFAVISVALSAAACTSARRFPLCPELATKSYPAPPPAGTVLNKYIAEQAAERKVRISILSPFAMVLTGRTGQISWFDKHYPFLLCSFDPANVILDDATYLTCMTNAERWVQIVRSEEPEDLMLADSHYSRVCVR